MFRFAMIHHAARPRVRLIYRGPVIKNLIPASPLLSGETIARGQCMNRAGIIYAKRSDGKFGESG